jgi:DNA-binding transcriptional LysR family regulator
MAVFTTIVEAGSLSAAGRRLNVPLATISRKIADLEAHLGARLLIRTTRHLSLTEAGQGYLAACKRILDEVDAAERAAAGEYLSPRGELTISAPIVFGRLHVLPQATAFLAAYPDVNLRLIQSDRIADLLEEHVDLAVRIGELPDSGLIATRIGVVRSVACASAAYLARAGAPATPTALADHACITFDGLMRATQWTFADDVVAPIRSRLVVNTAEAAIDAAISGLGVTRVLSYQAADAFKRGALTPILTDYAPPPIPVHLVRPADRAQPSKVRAFIDFAAPRLRKSLADATDSSVVADRKGAATDF